MISAKSLQLRAGCVKPPKLAACAVFDALRRGQASVRSAPTGASMADGGSLPPRRNSEDKGRCRVAKTAGSS